MSESNFHKLKEFIVERVGAQEDEVTPDSRLYNDLGIYGDDATELLIEYGKRFNVDVSKFMAADYFRGEGMDLIGGLLRIFTGKRWSHNYKVLTVNDLEKGINAGRLDEEIIAGMNDNLNYQVAGRDFHQTHFEQSTPTPIEWLLLRIIDAEPSSGNDYRLERFMAKTDACVTFHEDLRGLIKKGWLETKDAKAQVRNTIPRRKGNDYWLRNIKRRTSKILYWR